MSKSKAFSSSQLTPFEEEVIRLLTETNLILKFNNALLENINENVRSIKANTS